MICLDLRELSKPMNKKVWRVGKWHFILLTTLLLIAPLTACGGDNAQTNSEQKKETSKSSGRLATVKSRGALICGING